MSPNQVAQKVRSFASKADRYRAGQFGRESALREVARLVSEEGAPASAALSEYDKEQDGLWALVPGGRPQSCPRIAEVSE